MPQYTSVIYSKNDEFRLEYSTENGKFHGMLYEWNDREDDFLFLKIVDHSEVEEFISENSEEYSLSDEQLQDWAEAYENRYGNVMDDGNY